MQYASSAPGNIMLFGEHAVLQGKLALCAAVDRRLQVTLTPKQGCSIQIRSTLGKCQVSLEDFTIQSPFEFVMTVIQRYLTFLPSGFDLEIEAEFSAEVGLGSSAAVVVATLGALNQWLAKPITLLQLFHTAKEIILSVQGIGSGADVAAAIWGGVVSYRIQPLEIQSIKVQPEVILVYSGSKMPTPEVIRRVKEQCQQFPEFYEHLFAAIDACSQGAVIALQQKNWQALGQWMNQHQGLQAALGVSNPILNELIAQLLQQSTIYGAKISGSGLGDCVVGLGTLPTDLFPLNVKQQRLGIKQIPITISSIGYQVEKQYEKI